MLRRLRTRGYELDRHGTIPAATLLRYLEHLRWEAVAEAPALARAFEGGQRLVVVAQRLRIHRELGLGEELELSLTLEKVGRSSLEFGHRIVTVPTGELVAAARVTAVQLGPDHRPTPVADAIRTLIRPATEEERSAAGAPDMDARSCAGPERADGIFPPPFSPTAGAASCAHRFVVRPSDLDLLDHVNHANYLVYAEDARALAAASGEPTGIGAGPLRAVTLEYRRQAVLGDELEARVHRLGDRELGFLLLRGDELLCAARIETG